MADTRRIFGWLAVGAALALAGVLVLLVLRDDEPVVAPPPGGTVVSRATDARPRPDKPVISVPEAERRPPPRPLEVVTTGSITGRLVDAEHQPFASGRIEALQGDNAGIPGLVNLVSLGKRAVADAGGRFTLADVPAIANLTLRLEGEAFPPAEVGPYLVTVGTSTDLGDIVLQPGLAITGTVFDDLGAPVAGARIGLLQGSPATPDDGYAEPSIPEPARLVLSDDTGRFRIENAARDSFMLMVSATGFANALFPGGPGLGDQPSEIDMALPLRRAGTLRGRVLDAEDERPLAGVHVFAEPMDQGSGRSQDVTGADGTFVIRDIVPGNYALTASLKGYSRGRERSFDEKPDAEVVLRLDRQGSLAGTVVGSDGRPVHSFDMQPHFRRRRMDPPIARGTFQRVSSADGSFEAAGLDPGFWSVDVWAKGYSLTSSDAVKVKQGQAAGGLVVTLLRGSTLAGIVRDADGHVIAGAEVTLHANREPEVDFLRDMTPIPGVTHGTRTDSEGRFQLEDLSARAYQVQVDHPDYAIVRRNDVTLAAEAELVAEPFVLDRAATVRGAAVGPSGEPLAGVSVSLTAVNGFARQATTDGRGQFLFTRVRVGDYQLVCYGRQLSFSAMIASVKNPPEAFHVTAGADVQRNAISFE